MVGATSIIFSCNSDIVRENNMPLLRWSGKCLTPGYLSLTMSSGIAIENNTYTVRTGQHGETTHRTQTQTCKSTKNRTTRRRYRAQRSNAPSVHAYWES